MPSNSYTDIKRYLQVTKKLSGIGEGCFLIGNNRILPHPGESLFDDLPVITKALEEDSGIYGISHKDGVIYVQSIKKLKKYYQDFKTEQVDDYYLFPKFLFVDIQKLIPNSEANRIVHLHNHSEFSAADGLVKAEDYARRCKQLGFPSMALTDHGTMAGVIVFYKACKKYGVKPILGQEFYLDEHMEDKGAPDSFKKSIKVKGKDKRVLIKEYEKEHRINLRRHIVLLAQNEVGLKNLYKLSSIAYQEGYYYRPRIDWDVLRKYSEGIIASTACLSGVINGESDVKHKIENLRKLVSIFGKDRLFLEVMLIEFKEQPDANDQIFTIAEKFGLNTILTVDAHYVDPDPDHIHHLYMKIGSGYSYGEGDNYLKTPSEFRATFDKMFSNCKYGWKHYERAMANTFIVADKCNVELELGKFRLPVFDLSTTTGYQDGDTVQNYIERRIEEGWKQKIQSKVSAEKHEIYRERLKHEMDVIGNAGYFDYMLIVLDICDMAKRKGILYNVRGSAAASLFCYLTDITRVDPIKWELLFERFISAARTGAIDKSYQSFPDIDIDFGNRNEIITYLEEKYGKNSVARITTYSRMQLKAAFKGIAAATDFVQADVVNKLTSKMPAQVTTLEKALKYPEFKAWYDKPRNNRWFGKYVEPVIDLVGHSGMHASGVVVVPGNLIDFMPIRIQEKKKEKEKDCDELDKRLVVTQFEGDSIEDIGFLKLDILGVRTLLSLGYTKKVIKENRNVNVDFDKLDLENPRWYEPFQKGDTVGVFQLDTPGSTKLVREVLPENFKEVMATIALSRPGTAGPGLDMEYCYRKRGKSFTYDHPLLEDILKENYGIAIYQADVMKISHAVGGLSLIDADKIRKIMKKKDPAKMKAYQEAFVKGALQRGCKNRDDALSIWKNIESWSGYGFAKPHSCSYAQVSVWCMAMKILAPTEFYIGLLQFPKKKEYLSIVYKDIKDHNIDIIMPDINQSRDYFYAKNKKIVWTLDAVKNVGVEPARAIGANAPYDSIPDLFERVPKKFANKRVMDALICVNAFRDIYHTPKEAALVYYRDIRKEELPAKFNMESEKYWDTMFHKHIGVHMVDAYKLYADELAKFGTKAMDTHESFMAMNIFESVKIAGYIVFVKKTESKRGPMAIIRIQVGLGEISVVAWNSFYRRSIIEKTKDSLLMGAFVYVFGDKNTDPQGQEQVQLSDQRQDQFEILELGEEE